MRSARCSHDFDEIMKSLSIIWQRLVDSNGQTCDRCGATYTELEKAVKYLESTWEDNCCGLLYIPRAGNWADEYLQEGFVLYDEVLWFLALRKYSYMLEVVGDNKRAKKYYEKAGKVKNLIRTVYQGPFSVNKLF